MSGEISSFVIPEIKEKLNEYYKNNKK